MIVKGWFRPQLQTINKFYAEFDLLTYFACMFNLIWLITKQTNITKINKREKKRKNQFDYKEKTLLGKKTLWDLLPTLEVTNPLIDSKFT